MALSLISHPLEEARKAIKKSNQKKWENLYGKKHAIPFYDKEQ
jgi:hypothetical protein